MARFEVAITVSVEADNAEDAWNLVNNETVWLTDVDLEEVGEPVEVE